MGGSWSVRAEGESRSLEDRAVARLRELVLSGSVAPGEQLPSEPDLAKRLGVSRPTLRSAIAELVADRVLVRRRGVGTFVSAAPPHVSQGLERLHGTGTSIELLGRTPGVTGLRVEHLDADAELADNLQVQPGQPLVHFSRTRTADGVPVLHCEEWVPEDLLPEPAALDAFGTGDSLYASLAAAGLVIRQAVARFVPMMPPDWLRDCLEVEPLAPVLLLEQRHYVGTEIERVVLFSKNFYNTARIDLHTVRRS